MKVRATFPDRLTQKPLVFMIVDDDHELLMISMRITCEKKPRLEAWATALEYFDRIARAGRRAVLYVVVGDCKRERIQIASTSNCGEDITEWIVVLYDTCGKYDDPPNPLQYHEVEEACDKAREKRGPRGRLVGIMNANDLDRFAKQRGVPSGPITLHTCRITVYPGRVELGRILIGTRKPAYVP